MRRIQAREARSGDLSSPMVSALPVYAGSLAQIIDRNRGRLTYVDELHPTYLNSLWFETIDRLAGALNLTEPEP